MSRLTIDDLLNGGSSEKFIVEADRKGKPRVIKKTQKRDLRPTRKKYPVFFRLIGDNPNIPDPVEEFKFHPIRKWRIDICWPDQKLALEIEGGVWGGGRHVHPTGFMKDMEKYNTLSIFGYHLLRFTPKEMNSGESYEIVREWFKNNRKL